MRGSGIDFEIGWQNSWTGGSWPPDHDDNDDVSSLPRAVSQWQMLTNPSHADHTGTTANRRFRCVPSVSVTLD
jgi:hypothetical protein